VELFYQWYRSGKAIAGATDSSYILGAADIGKTIKVKVTGKKTGFKDAANTSKSSKKVVALKFTAPTPTISGTLAVGQTLSADSGVWTPLPDSPLSYQWYRSGKAIKGATGETYLLVNADKDKTIKVKVTGKKTGYATTSVTSNSTAKVRAV
jgi:hypothetical protein